MTLQEIIGYFQGAHRLNDHSYQCLCPAHPDEKASLTISEGKQQPIVLNCHAGCSPEDVLAAVGLTFADIGAEKPSETWRENLEKSVGKAIQVVYDYKDENGKYSYSKIRFVDKDMRFGRIIDGVYHAGRGDQQATLYNLPSTLKAIKEGFPVYIVEGEKDVETLKSLGFTACTAGGVSDWKKEYARYFCGARVVILPDKDEPGMKLNDRIIRDLKHYAYSVKSVITSDQEKGDVSDYIQKEGHTKEDFKELVKSVAANFAPWVCDDGNGKQKPIPALLAETIKKTLPFVKVRRHDDDKEDFYVYENGVFSQRNRNEIKACIGQHVPTALKKDNLLNEVYNLLLCSNDNVCSVDDLNAQTRYINLENGLYNIEERNLIPHSHDVLSTIQLKCHYNESAPKPLHFLKLIDDMCTDKNGVIDLEKKNVLQEWLGISLSNIDISELKKCLILYSARGNTGKSVFFNIISRLIGTENTINISMKKLEDRFSLGDVYGKRLIMVGDQESGRVESIAVFKQLTGADPVRVELKGKTGFNYRFRGGVLMACNDLPQITDDKGDHLFERMCIIPLENSIPEDQRDRDLIHKIMNFEKGGVLSWALEGLHRFLDNHKHFSECAACKEIMKTYRGELDTVYDFLSNRYTITGSRTDRIKTTDLYDKYASWCLSNERTALSKKNFKERLEKNGVFCAPYAGTYYYKGIKEIGFVDVTRENYAEGVFQEKCVS